MAMGDLFSFEVPGRHAGASALIVVVKVVAAPDRRTKSFEVVAYDFFVCGKD